MNGDLTGRTLGGYTILRKLGAGGMATVYKAHEGSLNRVVALKVIHEHLSRQPEFVERFHREARAAAQLSHPNIIQIYAVGEDDGMPYFSMEYVKGRSLQDIIETDGFLPARRAVPMLTQAAQALAAAHEAGIVHRDIKPSNIMIDAAGRVKVADFGIAQVATEDRLTRSGMMVGTPGYLSPEQCLGEKLDARSDIYSLGVTAYEMLSGHAPFQGETPAALILQIVDRNPAPLASLNPTVPADVQRIVEKMMHKDRTQRFQSADDVVKELFQIDLRTLPTTAQQPAAAAAEPTMLRATRPADGGVPPGPPVSTVAAAPPVPVAPTVAAPAASNAAVEPHAVAGAPPGPVGSSRSGLLKLALVVLLLLGAATAFAFVGWRRLTASAPEAPGPPPRSAAVTGSDGEADGSPAAEAGVDQPPTSSGESAAVPGAGDRVAAEHPSAPPVGGEVAPAPSPRAGVAAVAAAGSPPSTAEPGGPSAPGATPRGAAGEATPAIGSGAAPAAAPAARRTSAASARSVVTSTTGDSEHVDLVQAVVESALMDAGFEIVDYVPRNRRVEDVARFEVVSSVTIAGAREVVYYGRVATVYTASMTVRATDLATGTRAAGPFSATVEYSSINLEKKLTEGAQQLALDLVRDLDARLGRSEER